MHQNLLNAEFASVEYLNALNKTCTLSGSIQALTKVLHKCFCSICAYRQLYFVVN
jgi:hypothetical protein